MSIFHMLNRYSINQKRRGYGLIASFIAVSFLVQNNIVALAQDQSPASQVGRKIAMVAPATHAKQTHPQPGKTSKSNKPASTISKSIKNKVQESYPRSHYEKGMLLKQKHDLDNALIEFLKSTQEDPKLAPGFYEQALIFKDRGFKKLAQSSLEQALRIKPDFVEARLLLATIRLEQGNLGEAVQELSRTIAAASQQNNQNANADSTKTDSTKTENPKPDLIASLPVILQSIHDVLQEPIADHTETASAEKAKSPIEIASTDEPALKGRWKGKKRQRHPDDQISDVQSTQRQADESFQAERRTTDGGKSADATESATDEAGENKKSKHKRKRKALTDTWNKLAQAVDEKRSKRKKSKKHAHRHEPEQDLDGNAVVASALDGNRSRGAAGAETGAHDGSFGNNGNDAMLAAGLLQAGSQTISEQRAKSEVLASIEQNQAASSAAADQPVAESDFSQPVKEKGIANGLQSNPPNGLKMAGILANFIGLPANSGEPAAPSAPAKPKVTLDTDAWARKLKYFVDHGTSSMKDGEAFMFSEETGEATLFQANGATIRRIVAQPKDQDEVIKLRRPDILNPEEMLYNLSLLGKLIPKADNSNPAVNSFPASQSQTPLIENVGGAANPMQAFNDPPVLDSTQKFWGWLKSVLRF